jgi:hypothetical protein
MKLYSNNADLTWADKQQTIDRLRVMAQQVQFYYSIGNLSHSNYDIVATASSRMKMCKWCYQVVDYFKFSRETVQIGMSYFDRFLATPQGRRCLEDRSAFQLACITCMYVAIKVHEPIELDASLLCELSRGAYSVSEITQMEKVILQELQWRVNPPTATAFVQHIFSLLPSSSFDKKCERLRSALHQAELSVFDYSLVFTATPFKIAAAAVLNAIEGTTISLQSLIPSIFSNLRDMDDTLHGCQAKLLLCVQRNLSMPILLCSTDSAAVCQSGAAYKIVTEAADHTAIAA